jgi:thiol-disulfide isomerase/thioredoxin
MRAALLLLGGLLGSAACTVSVPAAHADCVGKTDCRPPLALTTLDGASLGTDALQGKVVLVNFWATWCAPCEREIPALQAVYERHSGDGFTILGMIAGDQSSDGDVKSFAARKAMGYPLVRSGPELERSFGLGSALPTSVLYDRRGKLVKRWEGDINERALEDLVKRTLAN